MQSSHSQLSNSSQQDEQSHDSDSFLCSLPREKGWSQPYLYKYQGFWHDPHFLQGIIACQQHFEAHDTDIILAANPKCGTTWLNGLVFTIVNRNKYRLTQQHPLLTNNSHDLVPYMELDLYFENKIPDFSTFTTPRLLCTHSPLVSLPKSIFESRCKLVYISRNPKDHLISYWHFINRIIAVERIVEPLSLQEAFDSFKKGVSLYGPYWDHVLDYWKASSQQPDKILFLKYEELKENPISRLRRLAEFLGFPFSAEEEASGMIEEILKLCSFDNMKNLEVNKNGKLSNGGLENNLFFRQGEVGDWKKFLSVEMENELDRITQEKFQGFGLI